VFLPPEWKQYLAQMTHQQYPIVFEHPEAGRQHSANTKDPTDAGSVGKDIMCLNDTLALDQLEPQSGLTIVKALKVMGV
jgi:hypothetical protein